MYSEITRPLAIRRACNHRLGKMQLGEQASKLGITPERVVHLDSTPEPTERRAMVLTCPHKLYHFLS